jgi:hypothetical protein
MLDSKPSTKPHEVVDRSRKFAMIVHYGSKSSCNAYWLSQPASRRQFLTVQVAGR